MPDTATTTTRLDLMRVEVEWRDSGVSADELLAVIEPLAAERPDSVHLRDHAGMHLAERWMIAWGWSITPIYVGETFNADRLHDRLGLWGDFCTWEDERVLWPALAPLIEPGSFIVYEPDLRWADDEDQLLRGHQWVGWNFDGQTAQLVEVEREVIWEPLTANVVWPA